MGLVSTKIFQTMAKLIKIVYFPFCCITFWLLLMHFHPDNIKYVKSFLLFLHRAKSLFRVLVIYCTKSNLQKLVLLSFSINYQVLVDWGKTTYFKYYISWSERFMLIVNIARLENSCFIERFFGIAFKLRYFLRKKVYTGSQSRTKILSLQT